MNSTDKTYSNDAVWQKSHKIGFSHEYLKMHGQRSGTLIDVEQVDRENLTGEFLEYDTSYLGNDGKVHKYGVDFGDKAADARLAVLVFIGDKLIPFTTIRNLTDYDGVFYSIGRRYDFVFKGSEESGKE